MENEKLARKKVRYRVELDECSSFTLVDLSSSAEFWPWFVER